MLFAQATSLSNEERARIRTRRWATYLVIALASAQIAIPLSPSKEVLLSSLTVVLLASTAYLFARETAGSEQLGATFTVIVALSFLLEAVGTHTGWPFGDYSYTSRLTPRLASVPLIVPLAWFAMTIAAREVARRIVSIAPLRWVLGGYLLAAWDLFLDPQMTHAGFWTWHSKGWWQGIPLSNYVGWFIAGTVLIAMTDRILGATRNNDGLTFLYGWMAFMSTLGFLLPFAFDRQIVGIVGGACTLPVVAIALIRKPVSWRASQ